MASTEHTDTAATCTCGPDVDVDDLRALIAAGYDQFEASRMIWGPHAPVSTEIACRVAGTQARRLVRTRLAALLPWLRLPTTIEQESTA